MDSESLVITPKPLKGEDGHRVISVRLRKEIVENLDDIAARTGRSRNELIGTFLTFALNNCVVEDGKE